MKGEGIHMVPNSVKLRQNFRGRIEVTRLESSESDTSKFNNVVVCKVVCRLGEKDIFEMAFNFCATDSLVIFDSVFTYETEINLRLKVSLSANDEIITSF